MPTAFSTILSLFSRGMISFTKEMITSSPVRFGRTYLDDWNRLDYRIGRYCFYWSLYENNAYDVGAHPWAGTFKTSYALYKNTRGCYNPSFRLGNFWAQHIWLGKLDAMKSNGRVGDSACPILTENDAIRAALMRLWRDSRMDVNKEVIPRCGAVMGDVAIRIEDDVDSGKVRILPVNPATLTWVRYDYQGNVNAYVIEERRWDPDFDLRQAYDPLAQKLVTYQERVTQVGKTIHYETYRDGELYPWNGQSAKYDVDYGFVPLVVIQHSKMLPDSCWGWSEFQGAVTKIIEADHVASNLHSQIRKASDPKFFIAGSMAPTNPLMVKHSEPSESNPQPAEYELPFIYGGLGSTAVPLVYPLDIQFTSMEIQNQLMNLEKDYPELRYDSARATGDASAKALREVRKACEAKVHGRRVAYDDALVRAHMMALSIGGMRGYEGYEDFDLQSYASGDLDHSIGERTVFLLDPLDRIEEVQALLTAWQTAKLAGVPAEYFMTMNNFDPTQIQLFQEMQAKEMDLALQQQLILLQAQAAAKAAAGPAGGAQGAPA
jgi:hypothetical protein